MQEEWKEIFDGYYEVSSFGRVKRAKPGKGTKVGRILSPSKQRTGKPQRSGHYRKISVWRKNKKVDAYVHRMVAEAFIGPCPEGYEVNHKDGNPANNILENLEYLTVVQNKQTPYLVNKILTSGENSHLAKLTKVDVANIRQLSRSGSSYPYIAKLFNVSTPCIHKIVRGL